MRCVVLCFFKQKTAYEMRISDWSSDVCSSDLGGNTDRRDVVQLRAHIRRHRDPELLQHVLQALRGKRRLAGLIAGIVQANDQAVTDELVAAHTGHVSKIAHPFRSEEHTSELQSLMRISYAVFCLKKKKKKKNQKKNT